MQNWCLEREVARSEWFSALGAELRRELISRLLTQGFLHCPVLHLRGGQPLSRVRLFATPWTVALQAPLSVEWVARSWSQGAPRPRDQARASCAAGGRFPTVPPGGPWANPGRGGRKEGETLQIPETHVSGVFLLCEWAELCRRLKSASHWTWQRPCRVDARRPHSHPPTGHGRPLGLPGPFPLGGKGRSDRKGTPVKGTE